MPRSGRTAWFSRLRACLAEPPALSPSTMNSSDLAGSRSWQSASLPGRLETSSAPFAPGQFARLARGFAGGSRLDHLADDLLGIGRVLLEPMAECLVDHAFDNGPDFGRHQLVLGLAGELRIRHLGGQHAGQPLARVVAGERDLLLLGDAGAVGVVVDGPGQGAAETGQVGAAIALRNVVGEAQDVLVITVVPPQCEFNANTVTFHVDRDRSLDERVLGAVEITHEGFDPAFVDHVSGLPAQFRGRRSG